MRATKHPHRLRPLRATTAHLNELLDEALRETFPASDPVAIDIELTRPRDGREAAVGGSAQMPAER
jgi:hypothetical protein